MPIWAGVTISQPGILRKQASVNLSQNKTAFDGRAKGR